MPGPIRIRARTVWDIRALDRAFDSLNAGEGGAGMTRSKAARPPYVQRFQDRHGKIRFYFRRPGYPRKPLPGPLLGPAFWAAYQAAMNALPTAGQAGVRRSQPYSLSALVRSTTDRRPSSV